MRQGYGGTEPEKLLRGQLGYPDLARTWVAYWPVPAPEKQMTVSGSNSVPMPCTRKPWVERPWELYVVKRFQEAERKDILLTG